ncbi:MAG TPA: zinc ribbon domain-containing protein [Pirellulaceae bacterium]|nr:zinc ribbon domain-containing protein [Pirellulaceae bacterium]
MNLIECPVCRNPNSPSATACPKCGHPLNSPAPAATPYASPPPAPPVPQRSNSGAFVGCTVVIVVVTFCIALLIGGGVLFYRLVNRQPLLPELQRSEASLIIGEWQFPNLPNRLEFMSDGTMREKSTLKSVDSTYELLGNGRMRTVSPGLFYGKNEQEWIIEFSSDGNSLTMTPNYLAGIPITLSRVR